MNLCSRSAVVLGLLSIFVRGPQAQDLPAVRTQNGASQLMVHGQPFLLLGGELGNSSAGTGAQADSILPRLAALHLNTVLVPVAWDQIEPTEGHFDFSILDHWIDTARQEHLHLMLLWFGSWKNAFSNYAPEWVLSDIRRFPRAISADGLPLEILSPLGEETARCDGRAFAALMKHLREKDAEQQTVLMIQVENEIGYLGLGGRDRSQKSNELFRSAVPAALSDALRAKRVKTTQELAAHFNPAGATWAQMFGGAADEVFMAWYYGRFANEVAEAGKRQYALPMYMNAQLPAPREMAGEYPSGGPYPADQAIYRVAAPAIDFYAPDIYWPNYEEWVERYEAEGNPVFVPESRPEMAPFNALFTFGQARGFGFCPFGVDSLSANDASALADEYGGLAEMSGIIQQAQQKNQVRGVILHATSARRFQTVALGGFLFRSSLIRGWASGNLLANDGAMMVLQVAPDEFYVMGRGLTVTFFRDPDADDKVAGIAAIERMSSADGRWVAEERLNGDQSNQGRELSMDPHAFQVYRVKLYSYGRQE